jgi:hypothetical protein
LFEDRTANANATESNTTIPAATHSTYHGCCCSGQLLAFATKFVVPDRMSKSKTKHNTKKAGRPKSTGAGAPMVVRMHDPQIKQIDRWIGDSAISRPEAIRQLVDWALSQTQHS